MPILLFPKSNGVPAAVSITFTEPTRSFVFSSPFPPRPTIAQLGLDINGNSEQTSAAYDFSAFPEILGGDTLALSPAPVIQAPGLSLGAITVSGNQVQIASVSLTVGTIGEKIQTNCRVWTTAGRQLLCYGDYVLIGAN